MANEIEKSEAIEFAANEVEIWGENKEWQCVVIEIEIEIEQESGLVEHPGAGVEEYWAGSCVACHVLAGKEFLHLRLMGAT